MLKHTSKTQKYVWDKNFSKRRNNSSGKKVILIFPILLLIIIVFFSLSKVKDIVSPISSFISEKEVQKSPIKEAIDKVIKDEKGTYSFYVKNLKTGEEVGVDEHKVYDTASLYKLWVAAELEDKIQSGQISKDDQVKEDVAKLNAQFNIASEQAELTDGEIDTTVSAALEQMIVVSDNYSALVLSKLIGLSNVTSFLSNYGFSESNLNPPRSTAYDIGQFYQLLYNSRIINTSASDEIMELLKDQKLNDRIPKYLPENVEIAHKTGELDGVKHDAGIIFAPFGDYILVAMSETRDPQHAAEVIARVSSEVYKYFEKEAASLKKKK